MNIQTAIGILCLMFAAWTAGRRLPWPYKREPELRWNPDGTLDELCGRNASAHLEQMDVDNWCLIVNGTLVRLWSKRPIEVIVDEHRGPCRSGCHCTAAQDLSPERANAPR